MNKIKLTQPLDEPTGGNVPNNCFVIVRQIDGQYPVVLDESNSTLVQFASDIIFWAFEFGLQIGEYKEYADSHEEAMEFLVDNVGKEIDEVARCF